MGFFQIEIIFLAVAANDCWWGRAIMWCKDFLSLGRIIKGKPQAWASIKLKGIVSVAEKLIKKWWRGRRVAIEERGLWPKRRILFSRWSRVIFWRISWV